MILIGEQETQGRGRVSSVQRVTKGGQVRWQWMVGGPKGSESGEERTRRGALNKAEKAKGRCW